jgi:hypothetical protein
MDVSGLGAVPDTTPALFTASAGTVTPAMTTFPAGAASATYQPAGLGVATITVTVDNEAVPVTITVTDDAVLPVPGLDVWGRGALAILLALAALGLLAQRRWGL